MKDTKLATLFLSLFCTINIAAQAARTSGSFTFGNNDEVTFAARPLATPQLQVIAIVNGQELTLADLDPKSRQTVEELEMKLAQIRRDVLTAQINSLLLDMEAARRNLTTDPLYNAEIANHVIAPTNEQIEAEYRAHPELYGQNELWLVRDGIAGTLRDRQEKKILEDWAAAKQQQKVNIAKNVNVSNPSLKSGTVLATVDGHKVTLGSLSERLKPRSFQARLETYEIEKRALDQAINNLLLTAEAKRKSVTPADLINAEITDKMHQPSEEEIKKYYEANTWRFKELASARAKIAKQLEQQERDGLEKALYERLRAGATIRVLIAEPEPPVQTINTASSPARGNESAPVTMVEFGDFQCYPCGRMHPIVEEALKPYGEKVRFVFREYPLSMHRYAYKAAEAALAAHAQGKFWEYSALLFKNQRALDVPSLKKYATELGLDQQRFNKALDQGLFAADVRRDMREGEILGVDLIGTPIYFINGIRLPLSAYSAEGLRKAIEDALAAPNRVKKQALK